MKNTYDPTNNKNYSSAFQSLRTIPAEEYFPGYKAPGGHASTQPSAATHPTSDGLETEQEYRFLKAVIDHPMQPSSSYIKLAGIRAEAAAAVREKLITLDYIRTHAMDTGRRGRSTLILEPLPAGIEAANRYEASRRSEQ